MNQKFSLETIVTAYNQTQDCGKAAKLIGANRKTVYDRLKAAGFNVKTECGIYENDMKKCPKCKQMLHLTKFYVTKRKRKDGLGITSSCKSCHNLITRKWKEANKYKIAAWFSEYNKYSRYGITKEKFAEMLRLQDYKCLICSASFRDYKNMHIDHDHRCCDGGKSCGQCIRGILCMSCNHGLGSFRDNPDFLLRAAKYVLEDKSDFMTFQLRPNNFEAFNWIN